MKKHIIKNKSAMSMVIVAAVIVIIVIAAVAGAYYYTTTMNPSTSPSPSASSTPSVSTSPSATTSPSSSASPSASPSASSSATPAASAVPIANFRAGAYANYTLNTYDNVTGVLTQTMPMDWGVTDGTINGTSVWVLTLTTTITADNSTTKSYLIYNVDKSTNKATSGELKVVTDGNVIMDQTIDISSPTYKTASSSEVDPNTIVGQETITVTAGTFNCEKAVTTESGQTSTIWISQTVPVYGMVKMITTEGTITTSQMELLSYG